MMIKVTMSSLSPISNTHEHRDSEEGAILCKREIMGCGIFGNGGDNVEVKEERQNVLCDATMVNRRLIY